MTDTVPSSRRERRARRTESAERGLLSSLGSAVMAVVLVMILAIAAAAIVVPAVTGSTALTVLTSSMEPNLPPGTLIVVRPTPAEEIHPGDIVTYQLRSNEPEVITHRVIQRTALADGQLVFITQGDANPVPDDAPVQEVQIRGTLWYAVPYLGWISVWLTGPWKAWAIPLAAFLLFGYAALLVVSHLRDKRRS
ncbi:MULTISPECIES: signal peptidase I [Microbacterium]|uniref:signal peptidase I n=1 Tax=Microbacterium TaxID=33882 RepID=UPI001E4C5045|nr:signal peptidase I [Microbacterium nymphoidis]MCD2499424.1 signal peptidase I [Microbacterium nymphoidis]